MMRSSLPAFALMLVFCSGFAVAEDPSRRPDAGEKSTLRGKLVQIHRTEGGYIFLNFERKYPENPFAAMVHVLDRGKFSDLDRFLDQQVEVVGIVRPYVGKMVLRLRRAEDIRVVAAQETPPETR